MSYYKFLDVGCKIGGSTGVCTQFGFKPTQGLGIDINIESVNKFISKGNHGIIADATNLPFKDNTFELVIFSHVLEHIPTEELGYKALKECIRVSKKNVFLSLPFFDEDEYINSLGFKTYYSDWTGHKNKVHLSTITKKYLSGYKYDLKMVKELKDSLSSEIIPISSPNNSLEYNPKTHGPKNKIVFDRKIWREFQIVIQK